MSGALFPMLLIRLNFPGNFVKRRGDDISRHFCSGSYGLAFGISIPDAIIAATVLIYDLELRTLNVKDFRAIPGLKINL